MEEEGSSSRQTDASLPSGSPRANAGVSPANPKLWTTQEDERLKAAVREYGNDRIDWKEVQQKFRLRAAKSCRLRWENQLKPDIDHSAFDAEEDELVLKMQQNEGNKWSLIAQTLTDNKRTKYAEDGTFDAMPGTPYRRTDNQVKNRWHSALEKAVKNGKSGHGFTDLEFEAEALRRVESEQRLLVTPAGEELRLGTTRNGLWEVRLQPAEEEEFRPQKRRNMSIDWDSIGLQRQGRVRYGLRDALGQDSFRDNYICDSGGEPLPGFIDMSSEGQCSSSRRDAPFLTVDPHLGASALSSPFGPLPDVFAGEILHSVELPNDSQYHPTVQQSDLGSLETPQAHRFEFSSMPFDALPGHYPSEVPSLHTGHDFDLTHQTWALEASEQLPGVSGYTCGDLDLNQGE